MGYTTAQAPKTNHCCRIFCSVSTCLSVPAVSNYPVNRLVTLENNCKSTPIPNTTLIDHAKHPCRCILHALIYASMALIFLEAACVSPCPQMAAAAISSDDSAAEVLWLAKLTNTKSVNSEASVVLSTSRHIAGCTVPAASCLALLQRECC